MPDSDYRQDERISKLMKKVGIMGGTFNPVHYGHLFLAESAYEQLGLDKILFIPTKNPPHKVIPGKITQEQRVRMLLLAIRDNPHFELSLVELEREGVTYTADTLAILTEENPDTEYYFIAGADSLMQLHTWRSPEKIFKLCTLAVAGRDDLEKECLIRRANELKEAFNARIIFIDMPAIRISSSEIRARVAAGRSIKYYVHDDVIKDIEENRLYKG